MLKQFIGISFLAAFGMAQAAQAADLTVVEETVVVVPAFSWTGFYAGVHAGYGWADLDTDYTDMFGVGNKPDGFFGGGQVGYNYQFANNVVLGIEADAAFASLKDDDAARESIESFYIERSPGTKIKSIGTVRARAGYTIDRFLPYVTGGIAWANAESGLVFRSDRPSLNETTLDSQVFTGWTVGAGLEYAVTNNVTAKVEYLYADLGSTNLNLESYGPGAEFRGDLSSLQTVKLGLNYKF